MRERDAEVLPDPQERAADRETSKEAFAHIEAWEIDVPIADRPSRNRTRRDAELRQCDPEERAADCPGEEGVRGLEIGNAMLMAGVTRQAVTLPMDAGAFDAVEGSGEEVRGRRRQLRRWTRWWIFMLRLFGLDGWLLFNNSARTPTSPIRETASDGLSESAKITCNF